MNPALTVSYSGFVNGDTPASLTTPPTITTTATAASGVGTYPITASGAASSNANYTISYASGTLTVTPAALTVTATNKTRTYGAANPAFTASFAGFVNGDTGCDFGWNVSRNHDGDGQQRSRDVCDHALGCDVDELRDHLCQRHLDGHVRGVDDCGQRSDQGVRRGESGVDGELRRLRQRATTAASLTTPPTGHDHRDSRERRRHLSDYDERRGQRERELHHHLRERHADGRRQPR